MRILLIHNFYQQFGGEDQVVLQERASLQKNHEVFFYSRHNDDLIQLNLAQRALAAVETVSSRRTTSDIEAHVALHHPDVAYVHNVYPLISPSVYHSLHALGVPIVQVIHDFRPLCTNGWFYNRTGVCERCMHGNYLHAIRHRCYKRSYSYSALYAATMAYMRGSGALSKIDAFICLTEFARRRWISAGVPAERLFVRPNSVDASQIEPAAGHGDYVAYIGRLSREKGLWTLIQAMERVNGPVLKIAGTGPEEDAIRDYIKRSGLQNIELVGFLSGDARTEFLRNSMFTVLPSEWYEMFPMVLLEAWAAGKAVIGSRLGATGDLIEEGCTGLLASPADPQDLALKIRRLYNSPDSVRRMGAMARLLVESKYSPQMSEALLIDIFRQVVNGSVPTSSVRLTARIRTNSADGAH
jgi:glycosyltransferase involved in cell wall biosynthesis